MKSIAAIFFFLLLVCVSANPTNGQSPDLSKESMKKLAMWPGRWTGTSTSQMQGKTESATVEEIIEWKVDGHALLVNGLGKKEGKVVHEALGVLSFDTKENRYRFRSWLRDGRNADTWFQALGDNKFQWGFDVPTGKIRYNIQLTQTTWVESGEYSADGTQWFPFFQMQLTRQE
jgi:hypothetical protein